MLLFLHFLVLWDRRIQNLFENRISLNPGLGGVRDVASAIISQEQSAIFKLWMLCFQIPKDLFRLLSLNWSQTPKTGEPRHDKTNKMTVRSAKPEISLASAQPDRFALSG